MPGGRKTHDFPNGRPLPLILVEVVFVVGFVAWMVIGGSDEGAHSWRRGAVFVAIIVSFMYTQSRFIRFYEHKGLAIPIRRQTLVTRFVGRKPIPIIITHSAFFVAVAAMLFLGLGPVEEHTARTGIIACVLALVAIAIIHLILERHYINNGRASEVDVSGSNELS
jgi:hypothetical protein